MLPPIILITRSNNDKKNSVLPHYLLGVLLRAVPKPYSPSCIRRQAMCEWLDEWFSPCPNTLTRSQRTTLGPLIRSIYSRNGGEVSNTNTQKKQTLSHNHSHKTHGLYSIRCFSLCMYVHGVFYLTRSPIRWCARSTLDSPSPTLSMNRKRFFQLRASSRGPRLRNLHRE